MTKRNKNLLNISFMLLLFFITIYVIFSNNDIEDVMAQIKGGNYKILACAMLMMLCSLLCESTMIFIMLKSMHEKIKFPRCVKYSFIGFYYCAITPSASGGQPAQILYMKKDGYKVTTSSVIILTLVSVYKAVLLMFVAVAMFFNGSMIISQLDNLIVFFIFGVLINTFFIVFVILLFVKPSIVRWIIEKTSYLLMKIKLIKNPDKIISYINRIMDDYIKSISYIKDNIIILLPVFALTILQRFLLFAISYVVYRFFGLNHLSLLQIISLQVTLNTAVDSLPVPGGIGASEAAFKHIYSVAYTESLMIPAMLVTRFINFYYMLIVSAIFSLIAHYLMIRNDFRKEDIS